MKVKEGLFLVKKSGKINNVNIQMNTGSEAIYFGVGPITNYISQIVELYLKNCHFKICVNKVTYKSPVEMQITYSPEIRNLFSNDMLFAVVDTKTK